MYKHIYLGLGSATQAARCMQSLDIAIGKARKIKVIDNSDYKRKITVTFKQDGIIEFCNHAGAELEDVWEEIHNRPQPVDRDIINQYIAHVCDKCGKIETILSDEEVVWL